MVSTNCCKSQQSTIKIPACLLPFVRVWIMGFFLDVGGFLFHIHIIMCDLFSNYYALCVVETKIAVQDPGFVLVK